MQTFILLLLSFLSVVGAVELFRKFIFWLNKPKAKNFYCGAVIYSVDEAEMTVRSLIERIRWMDLDSVRLILIDKSNDPLVKEIVEKIVEENSDISLF